MPIDPVMLSETARPLRFPSDAAARARNAVHVARSCYNFLSPALQLMIWDRLSIEAKAVLDLTVEAMLLICCRPGEHVEQIERGRWRYSAHGVTCVLSDRQLLTLAGFDEAEW